MLSIYWFPVILLHYLATEWILIVERWNMACSKARFVFNNEVDKARACDRRGTYFSLNIRYSQLSVLSEAISISHLQIL